MRFSDDQTLVPHEGYARAATRLEGSIQAMNEVQGSSDAGSSIALPLDEAMQHHVKDVALRYADADTLIIIGIGGSNLGTMAVHHALRDEARDGMKVLYADTVDERKLARIITTIEEDLDAGRRVVINAISKSGGTTETVANLILLVDVLRRTREDWREHVIITTGGSGGFQRYADKHGLQTMTIPENVGGRFSVLSPVGLLPLAIMGYDIEALCSGAAEMLQRCRRPFHDNPAARSAAFVHHHHCEGKNVHDTFLFSTRLESLGKWYRQLMGESVGKRHDVHGNEVFAGITPTVSIGSTDLHSISQLLFGGPHDKSISFVTVGQRTGLRIPDDPDLDDMVAHLRGRPVADVMQAIIDGVQTACRNEHRPYTTVTLSDLDEGSIGAFLQFKMCEIMYLADLMEVNAFDQPAVETYKQETRRILADHAGSDERIIIGADHAGFALKQRIAGMLSQQGYAVEDVGTDDPGSSDDYPVYAERVGRKVAAGGARGILICGTGTGMVIAANKIPGVRAQVGYDEYSARKGREDNDTNVLCLRARETDEERELDVVRTWLSTPFSGEDRHRRRIEEVGRLECDR